MYRCILLSCVTIYRKYTREKSLKSTDWKKKWYIFENLKCQALLFALRNDRCRKILKWHRNCTCNAKNDSLYLTENKTFCRTTILKKTVNNSLKILMSYFLLLIKLLWIFEIFSMPAKNEIYKGKKSRAFLFR